MTVKTRTLYKQRKRAYEIKPELSKLEEQLTVSRELQNRNEEFLKRLNNKNIIYIDELLNTDIDKDKSLNTRKVFKSRLNVIHKLIHNKPLQKDTTINDFIDYEKIIKTVDNIDNKSLQPFYNALLKLFAYHNEKKKHNLEYKTIKDPEVKKMITSKSVIEKKEWVDYEVL
eukprot:Pgem_evm3s228